MATSELQVVNRALIRLGVPPVGSLDSDTAQGLSAQQFLDSTREELLADHPWSFALREVTPSELSLSTSDTLRKDYDHAYQLPNGLLRTVGLKSYAYYQLSEDVLYTNDSDPTLVYIADTEVTYWTPHFRRAVEISLAAAFALPVTDSSNRANLFYREAESALRRARSLDSQSVPAEMFNLMRVYARASHNPLAGG